MEWSGAELSCVLLLFCLSCFKNSHLCGMRSRVFGVWERKEPAFFSTSFTITSLLCTFLNSNPYLTRYP